MQHLALNQRFEAGSRAGRTSGFTLVELIIVVVILGILAALAIPQFTTSTADATNSTLKGDLKILRNAINLYYHEHNQAWPGELMIQGNGLDTGVGQNPAAFNEQMLLFTNAFGKTSATKDPDFPYGPYILSFPDNPLNRSGATADAFNVTGDVGTLTADVNPTEGWKYSKLTGKIIANDAMLKSW